MRLKKMFKNKLAFTLVELVIAIAVMAILAGAVAGAVVGVRNSAYKSAVTTPRDSLKTTLQTIAASELNATTPQTGTKGNSLVELIKVDFPDTNVIVEGGTKKKDGASCGDNIYIIVPAKPTAGYNQTDGLVFYICSSRYYCTLTANFKSGTYVSGSTESNS